MFRQATQGKEESIDEFHTRLHGLAKHCEFADADFEINANRDEWHFFETRKIRNKFSASGWN